MTKPQILYAMPRTRSSAILRSSLKTKKLHEPFDNYTLFGEKFYSNSNEALNSGQKFGREGLGKKWQENVTDEMWEKIRNEMNDPNSVSKFFGHSLWYLDRAAEWFADVENKQTHEIFVVVRDLREVCWSYFIAWHYGWQYRSDLPLREISISPDLIKILTGVLRGFFLFLPKNAHLISWEHLPSKYFNKNLNSLKNQNSQDKISLITNRDWCEMEISNIVTEFQPKLDNTVYRLPWAPL